jgi:hypothetical protein
MIDGTIVFVLGLWMWLHVLMTDVANGEKLIDRAALIVFMMWVAPAIIVLVGSYIQSIRRKRWSVVLVLIGCISVLPFVALNAWFTFGYSGDTWGLRAVYADLITVAVTMVVSMLNAALNEPVVTTCDLAQSP